MLTSKADEVADEVAATQGKLKERVPLEQSRRFDRFLQAFFDALGRRRAPNTRKPTNTRSYDDATRASCVPRSGLIQLHPLRLRSILRSSSVVLRLEPFL